MIAIYHGDKHQSLSGYLLSIINSCHITRTIQRHTAVNIYKFEIQNLDKGL